MFQVNQLWLNNCVFRDILPWFSFVYVEVITIPCEIFSKTTVVKRIYSRRRSNMFTFSLLVFTAEKSAKTWKSARKARAASNFESEIVHYCCGTHCMNNADDACASCVRSIEILQGRRVYVGGEERNIPAVYEAKIQACNALLFTYIYVYIYVYYSAAVVAV